MKTEEKESRPVLIDTFEVSLVDKAANYKKVVYKRIGESKTDLTDGGDEMPKEEKNEFNEENKKELLEKSKSLVKDLSTLRSAQNPDEAPPELLASIKQQEKELFGEEVSEFSEAKTETKTETETIVSKEDPPDIKVLEDEMKKDKRYLEVLKERDNLREEIRKLESRMPERKSVEFPDDEVPEEKKDDLKRRFDQSQTAEHKHNKEEILDNLSYSIGAQVGAV